MNTCTRIGLLIALALMCVTLAGCPGMPGAAGGKGASSQLPPGLQPPPGVQSGGARTLMGTTITPPENSVLLMKYSYAPAVGDHAKGLQPDWQSCRRIIPAEAYVLVEGVNFDGRAKEAEKDVNQLVPVSGIEYFCWKYEPEPAASQPAGRGGAGQQEGRGPRPGPQGTSRSPAERATSGRGAGR